MERLIAEMIPVLYNLIISAVLHTVFSVQRNCDGTDVAISSISVHEVKDFFPFVVYFRAVSLCIVRRDVP